MIAKVMHILRKKIFLSFSGNLIFAGIGMLNFLLLTRSLEQTDFGDWVIFITVAGFIDMFRFGLTRNAIVRFSSSVNLEEKKNIQGVSFLIGLVMVIVIALVFSPVYWFVGSKIQIQGYALVLLWYPAMALANLSWNNALSFLQAEQKFGNILLIRFFNVGSFTILLLLHKYFFFWTIETLILLNILTNVLSSFITMAYKWDGMLYIFRSTRASAKQLIDFGKYTLGSIAGSSLLKSADTFIIGLSPILGSAGVALYAIPLKLTEILEIPLRSFAATAFPTMSKASIEGKTEELKNIFYTYSGATTLLFIPISIFSLIFADDFVWILGGDSYRESSQVLGNVFRVFAVYGIFLPIDRYSGVALDSINKPKLNFYKVLVMAAANIIGDCIAVFYFESLAGVAVVTLLFTFIGLGFGLYYFSKEVTLSYRMIFVSGIQFFRKQLAKL